VWKFTCYYSVTVSIENLELKREVKNSAYKMLRSPIPMPETGKNTYFVGQCNSRW